MDHLLQQWHHEQVGKPFEAPDPLPLVVHTGPFKYVSREMWTNHLKKIGREDLLDQFIQAIQG